jgi:hypothetical protein
MKRFDTTNKLILIIRTERLEEGSKNAFFGHLTVSYGYVSIAPGSDTHKRPIRKILKVKAQLNNKNHLKGNNILTLDDLWTSSKS